MTTTHTALSRHWERNTGVMQGSTDGGSSWRREEKQWGGQENNRDENNETCSEELEGVGLGPCLYQQVEDVVEDGYLQVSPNHPTSTTILSQPTKVFLQYCKNSSFYNMVKYAITRYKYGTFIEISRYKCFHHIGAVRLFFFKD